MISQKNKPIESAMEKLNKLAFNYVSSRSPLLTLFMCAAAGAVDRLSYHVPAPREVGVKQLDTGTLILTSLSSSYCLAAVTLNSVFESGALFNSLPSTAATVSLVGLCGLTNFEFCKRINSPQMDLDK